MNNKPVANDLFIKTWEEANSAEEVASRLGMKVDTAKHKATKLRKEGVPLSNKRLDINYKELNSFVESVINNKADLTPREIILLYLVGFPVKEIATLKGGRSTDINQAIKRYRHNGVILPRRKQYHGKTKS